MNRAQFTADHLDRSGLMDRCCHFAGLFAVTVLVAVGASAADIGKTNLADLATSGAKSGAIAFKLTTPEELQELLGKPERKEQGRDGEMSTLTLEFPQVVASFGRVGEFGGIFFSFRFGWRANSWTSAGSGRLFCKGSMLTQKRSS